LENCNSIPAIRKRGKRICFLSKRFIKWLLTKVLKKIIPANNWVFLVKFGNLSHNPFRKIKFGTIV
jgi:hypothetical protein